MPFTLTEIQTMPAREVDYAIAENILGWQQVSEGSGLPPNTPLAIRNLRQIPHFTMEREPAEEVRRWLEHHHPWPDVSGQRATITAGHDATTNLYAACVILNHEDPDSKLSAYGETVYLAYGRLALIAWLELRSQ